jgi:preprotein translocase subunit SecD
MAKDIQQRTLVVSVAVVAAILTLLPTILRENFTQKWFTKPIALGLDISGGVHLVYNVKASEAVTSRLQTTLQSVRADLRSKKIAVAQSNIGSDNSLNFTLASDLSLEEAKKVVADKAPELSLSGTQNEGGRPRLTYAFSEKAAKNIEAEAIDQAVETLRNRVDQFGVTEPLIQRSGETRIILQMPGVSDINAVKRVRSEEDPEGGLGGTA